MDWDAYTNRLFQIESGGNPNAVTGSNRGLGQFSPDLEAKYGITDANRTDRNAQAQAVQGLAQDNAAAFQKSMGRAPTPAELYLAHQQGAAGAPALLKADPSSPAWQAIRPYYNSDAMAQKAITGNIPSTHALYGRSPNDVSAGDFSNMWLTKFGGSAPAGNTSSLPGAPVAAAAPSVPPGSGVAAAPDASAPMDIRPLTPPAPQEAAGAAAPAGMIDPNKLAQMAGKFGNGNGMLNSGNQGMSQAAQDMLAPSRINGGTPMSQMMKQQLLASILKR